MINIYHFLNTSLSFFDNQLPDQKEDSFQKQRDAMVSHQIQVRGIQNERVLNALRKIKRHLFIPEKFISFAYNDSPLPIGNNQTISQPYIVALMTELANIKPTHKVLEIGTGCGYQTAILAELAKKVFSLEIISELAKEAREKFLNLRYQNIEVICGDGYAGYQKEAPYDAIIVTAAANELPLELIKQLKIGGRMIIPIGECLQELYCITKDNDNSFKQEAIIPVRFVPMMHSSK
ncbi:MAG: protein-L-isoaspartate(D-aspartate) O-methyltransferase [Candidatus Omnitrophota bacterium]